MACCMLFLKHVNKKHKLRENLCREDSSGAAKKGALLRIQYPVTISIA